MAANADQLLAQAYAAQNAGDLARASEFYVQVIACAPARPEAYVNLGHIKQNAGDFDAAAALYRQALVVAPDTAFAHLNLGVLHVAQGDDEGAVAAFQAALALQPDLVPAIFNLASAYERGGRLTEALAALDRLVALAPGEIPFNLARAQVQFALGRWSEAWASYNHRHRIFWPMGRSLPGAPWRGQDARGKTVLLSYEQGMGEQIMFASMIPEIAAQAGHVIVECEARLVALLARSFPQVEVVPWRSEGHPRVRAPEIAFHAALGDPGAWLRDHEGRFPVTRGYLIADPAATAASRARYEVQAKGRIIAGLSWHSAAVTFGAPKSVPYAALAPLLERDDVFWVNLQHGPARDVADPRLWTDADIDPGGDFDPLAAQVAAMDVVAGASTATMHLAGGLGKSTYVLLPKVHGRHWYWFPEKAAPPWYPSVRTFMQDQDGVWETPIKRLSAALTVEARAR